MKYRNASDILPDTLLKEVQKYASGEALYIPSRGVRRKWGDNSGARTFYEQRNERIRCKFLGNVSVDQLAEEFFLSVETIKKIVYRTDSRTNS